MSASRTTGVVLPDQEQTGTVIEDSCGQVATGVEHMCGVVDRDDSDGQPPFWRGHEESLIRDRRRI
ncbi:hypothetical protein BRC91_06970 [Halobacteriales archaeon QS_4_62_28]|nr:MAG: hypothetical protein BRC91_06970 [Halobacteriales archaeon QS_4_62_28]